MPRKIRAAILIAGAPFSALAAEQTFGVGDLVYRI